MKPSVPLKRLLNDSTRLYAGERVPVRFTTGTPHYAGEDHGGPYLAVNPDVNGYYDPEPPVDGPNELRLLRDTLSHEAFEFRMGHPSAKAAISFKWGTFVDPQGNERYDDVDDLDDMAIPSPKARAAGTVYNILRDAWVNTARCRRFPGLRRGFALKADLLAGEADVSELRPAEAVVAGLHQISLTDTARGVDDADDEVRTLLGWARRYVEVARTVDTHDELAKISDHVIGKFEPLFDDPDAEFEQFLKDLDKTTMAVRAEDMSRDDLADMLDDMDGSQMGADLDARIGDDDGLEGVSVSVSGGGHSAGDDAADAPQTMDDTPDGPTDGDATDYYPEPPGGWDDEDAAGGAESGAGGSEGDSADEDLDGDTGAAGGHDEDAGDEGQAGGSTGGDDADFHVDLDDEDDRLAGSVRDLLDDMDDRADDDHRAGDMLDLDDEDDYHEAGEGSKGEYERIRDESLFASTKWGERMERRDAYEGETRGDLSADEIRSLMRETGLAQDLRRAFQQIKTREVREPTKRQTKRLHLGNVVRHMAGDYAERRVYERTYRGASGGRTICGVVDASGSMGSGGSIGADRGGRGAIVDAKVVLAALHIAANEIGDEVVATSFDTSSNEDVRLVTGPDESFAWDHLDGFSANGGSTPTAAGVLDGLRLLRRAGGNDRVMVVITDGGANKDLDGHETWAGLHGADGATDDARRAVELARDEGITVFGVAVGSSAYDSKMNDQFGPDMWAHVEVEDLVDAVVRMYREQLDDDRVADVAI